MLYQNSCTFEVFINMTCLFLLLFKRNKSNKAREYNNWTKKIELPNKRIQSNAQFDLIHSGEFDTMFSACTYQKI